MRILVTGSRDWPDKNLVSMALVYLAPGPPDQVTLVSGSCPTGADRMAEEFAEAAGWNIERYPAEWEKYGKRAGYLRNKAMVDSRPDLTVGFILNQSKGGSMTVDMSRKAGIDTYVVSIDIKE